MNIFDEEGLIDSEVQDILYELGNVGLGMASITLGKLMGVRLHIGVPNILTVNEHQTSRFEPAEGEIGVMMQLQKTLRGSMILIFKKNFAQLVIKSMAEGSCENLDTDDRVSVIQEFANIICAAYLKAIGQYTGIRLYVRPAGLHVKDIEDIIAECHRAICVETRFSIACENGQVIDDVGRVIMLPDEESVEKLVEPLFD